MVEENKKLEPPNSLLVRDGEYQTYGTEEEAIDRAKKTIDNRHLLRIFRVKGEVKVNPEENTPREIDLNPKVFVLIFRVEMYARQESALANVGDSFELLRDGTRRIFIVDQSILWS